MPMPAKPTTAARTALPPTPDTVSEILRRLIALIDELVVVMDEERPLVEQRKRAEHAELLKRKQRLTIDYRSSLKTIALQPEALKQVPESLRAEARAAANRLAEASERNARTLRAIMTASQRLVQSIVSLVKSEYLPKTGYKNTLAGQKIESYSPICKPVSVFKSV